MLCGPPRRGNPDCRFGPRVRSRRFPGQQNEPRWHGWLVLFQGRHRCLFARLACVEIARSQIMKKLVLESTAPFQGLPELVAYDEGLFAREGLLIEWVDRESM